MSEPPVRAEQLKYSRSVELELPTGERSDRDIPLGGSPFPPIADYGLLSDCEVCALVAPSGNVEWLSLPQMDGPGVFSAILDRHAGRFRVGPVDRTVPAGRRYLPGTMILETTWGTPTGWLEVYDVLLIGPWHHDANRASRYARAPRDREAEQVLLRVFRCVDGFVDVELDCEPAFDYGRTVGVWRHVGEAYADAICDADKSKRGYACVPICAWASRADGRALRPPCVPANRRIARSVGASTSFRRIDDAHARLDETRAYWQEWIRRGSFPDHPWQPYLQRSALTLKGLTYAPTGAMIAAATTSLPETPAASETGTTGTAGFETRRSRYGDCPALVSPGKRPTTSISSLTGSKKATFRSCTASTGGQARRGDARSSLRLRGRPSRPCGQRRLAPPPARCLGRTPRLVRLHTHSGDRLDDRLWPLLARQVDEALAHWREPDRGIWEVRGDPQHFTSSKLFCWVAADRGARLARLRGDEKESERWETAAQEMHADICEHGTDDRGVFVQHYGGTALDASLLLLPLVGFLPPSDDRVRATVLAIADELTVDGLVLRYRVEETDDGLDGEEGTFTICSFWLVSALAEIGELERARTLCEKLLSYASPLLLYAEEIEPHSGRHLGNFPQAFTHLALINAVMHIVDADEVLSEGTQEEQPDDGGLGIGLTRRPATGEPEPERG